MPRQVTQCPVCDAPVRITELSCARCDTRLHGDFPPAPLARLNAEQQRFVETFIVCRGVIRDVERALGVSYPTVRGRLDAVVLALEAALDEDRRREAAPARTAADRPSPAAAGEARRREILRRVEAGEMDVAAAAEALREG